VGAEAIPQLAGRGAGLLDRVVEHSGRDHVVGGAGVVEQPGHLQRVLDERCAVRLAALPGVPLLGVGKRRARLGEARYQIGKPSSTSHDGEIVREAGIYEDFF
jgi:hypothetical protein